MSTLLLSAGDVSNYLQAPSLLESLREALVLGPGSALRERVPVETVRVTASRANAGLEDPGAGVLLHVYEARSGTLLALLEATRLLALQRALLGAIAADALAPRKAASVGLVGARAEASLQLKTLRLVRSLNHVRIYDREPAKAALLARRIFETLSLPTEVSPSVEEAVGESDMVIVEESAAPVLFPGMVREGTYVQALGGAGAFSDGLLAQWEVFEAGHEGREGARTRELGELLRGDLSSLERPLTAGVRLFTAMNPTWLDSVSAWDVFQGASQDDSLQRFDFARPLL